MNPSRATIPLIRPHQCDSDGGRIRGVLLYHTGKTYTVHTPKVYGYRLFWLNVTQPYFVFHVRACRDAHIVMSSRYGLVDSATYEVVIGAGDNQQTLIRDERLGWTMSQQYTPEMLSCEQKRAFWVAFDGGRIRVGEAGLLLNFLFHYKRMKCICFEPV